MPRQHIMLLQHKFISACIVLIACPIIICAQATAYPGQPPREAQRPFARSDRVARLQSAMIGQGIYTGPVDGVMNERTRSSIRSWQGRLGDPRTGTLTQMEVVRLLNGGGAP